MKFDPKAYPHSELTGAIIASAQEVHGALRPGLDEKIYENALTIELGIRGIDFEQQARFPIFYKDKPVGTLVPDLVVDRKVIVETKVADEFSKQHISQVLGYLSITNLEIGLLLNFKNQSLRVKRVSSLKQPQ